MACAGLLLASVLASVTSGLTDAARSTVEPSASANGAAARITASKPIDLSIAGAFHAPAILFPDRELTTTSMRPSDSEARPAISLGPLQAQFGGVTGRHMHLATVRLEGVSIFGGSVGGSIDSRSARITLTWPTSP